MTFEPHLWGAFDSAKAALLNGIRDSLNTISPSHILSIEPRSQDHARSSMLQTIDELSAMRSQLLTAVAELEDASNEIQLGQHRVQTSLAPSIVMPPEIVRHIFKYVVAGPEDTSTILQLSHVCTSWGRVMTSTSELFTRAEWNYWHGDLVALWVHRGRGRPQVIDLEGGTLDDIFPYLPLGQESDLNLWFEVFVEAMLDCVELSVQSTTEETTQRFSEWFGALTTPTLGRFEIHQLHCYDPPRVNMPENAPALRDVEVDWVIPNFQPSHYITRLHCYPGPADWSMYANVLKHLHHLEHLKIRHYSSDDGPVLLELPSLRILELQAGTVAPFPVIEGIRAPKVLALVLVDVDLRDNDDDWRTVVSALFSSRLTWPNSRTTKGSFMQSVTSLLLIYRAYGPYELSFNPLCRASAHHLLPHLSELKVFGAHYKREVLLSLQDFLIQREGKIKSLTVAPSLEEENAEMFNILKGLVPDFRVRDCGRSPFPDPLINSTIVGSGRGCTDRSL